MTTALHEDRDPYGEKGDELRMLQELTRRPESAALAIVESPSFVDLVDKVDDLEPLWAIAEELGVSESQLVNWASRKDKNGFPEPAATLGKYILYDKIEVFVWYKLWQKVTKRMVAGAGLRNQKEH